MKNSTNKVLTIAVVLLLITNIALVAFMMFGKGKKDGRRGGGKEPSEMMVKELGMTEDQKKQHKQLREEHFKTLKPYFDSLRTAKAAFFQLTKMPDVNDSTINNYYQKVANWQLQIDKLTFAHFKKVRTIFSPEQQPKFDEFVQKMMQRGRRDSARKDK
jgi:Spy/CpxP family protein refolding chaperone